MPFFLRPQSPADRVPAPDEELGSYPSSRRSSDPGVDPAALAAAQEQQPKEMHEAAIRREKLMRQHFEDEKKRELEEQRERMLRRMGVATGVSDGG
jgi:hypothetical protein